MLPYLAASFLAFFLAVVTTPLIRRLAWRLAIIDRPDQIRKLQSQPVALLGGWAIFIGISLTALIFRRYLIIGDLTYHHWLGVWLGGLILMIGRSLDDRYNLPPHQLIFQFWPF